jgi:glucose-1-phosphate adenylyltransferase
MKHNSTQPKDLNRDTVVLILAGGNGTRLGELTRWQCKPAVTFAGHFRNIDFTLSNCVNSGIRRIAVLTQYKSQSLLNHLAAGWNFLARPLGEFIEVWPAQQRMRKDWYAGTADAVYQNLDLLRAQGSHYTLILAGDHVYKMDYRALLNRHVAASADVTVACVPVPVAEASAFGVLGVDDQQRVRSFIEKPAPESLGHGHATVLASMGVYVFRSDYLFDRLCRDAARPDSAHDFGRDLIPAAVREDHVIAHPFTDATGRPAYWRDVGTLHTYWQAHMELLLPRAPMELFDPQWPVLTAADPQPPARVCSAGTQAGSVLDSLLAGGVLVRGATVVRSVLSSRVCVESGSVLEESVVLPGARVGRDCHLHRVIVDAGVTVPDGTRIRHEDGRVQLLTGATVTDASEAKAGGRDLRSVA